MSEPQIAIRVPPVLVAELDSYIERTGLSKIDVVVSAIAQYLNCADEMPLSHRVVLLKAQMKELTELVKSGSKAKQRISQSQPS